MVTTRRQGAEKPGQSDAARSVGARIRQLRLRAGLSQADLAEPDFHDSYISRIENGGRYPSRHVLQVLASRLECTVTYLISGLEESSVSSLRSLLAFAEIALSNGEVVDAEVRFAEALAHPDLAALPALSRSARWGHALTVEASGDLGTAALEMASYAEHLDPTVDPDHWAAVHLALCRCHRDRGSLDAAAAVGEHGLAGLSRIGAGWTETRVKLGATLMAAYLYRNDLASASNLSRRLIGYAQQIGTPGALMAVLWSSSHLAQARGQFIEALSLTERAVALLGEENDPRNLARIHVSLAHKLLLAHPEQAADIADLLERAAGELAESAAGTIDIADCKLEQARVALQLDRPDLATALAHAAITMLRQANAAGVVLAEAHTVLGNAYARSGRRDAAINILTDAARRAELAKAPRVAAQAWYDLAGHHHAAGDYVSELDALQHALERAFK